MELAQPADDQDLIARVAARDERALASLYDRYAPAALAVATRIVGDRAAGEDVVQDVFVRVWEEAPRFDPARGSVAAWLLSSVRHRAIDLLRRRQTQARLAQRVADETPLASGVQDLPEDYGRLRSAVQSLPHDQRETIELAYFEGLTQTQLAERLGAPLGTIKSRIRLAMKKLRDTLWGAGAA